MNYNNPAQSGKEAFLNGKARDSNPIDYRTNANAWSEWFHGWDEQNKMTCKGENCKAISGIGHSNECIKNHEDIYKKIRA